jgi:hypothetical protein
LHVDIGVDRIGVVFEVIGIFEDIFVGVVVGDFDVDLIGVDGSGFDNLFGFFGEWGLAFQARLFCRLFGGAFRADGGVAAEVKEACAARDAGMFRAKIGFCHVRPLLVGARLRRN